MVGPLHKGGHAGRARMIQGNGVQGSLPRRGGILGELLATMLLVSLTSQGGGMLATVGCDRTRPLKGILAGGAGTAGGSLLGLSPVLRITGGGGKWGSKAKAKNRDVAGELDSIGDRTGGAHGRVKKQKRGGVKLRESREKAWMKRWQGLTEEQRQEVRDHESRVQEIIAFAKENEIKVEQEPLNEEEIQRAVNLLLSNDRKGGDDEGDARRRLSIFVRRHTVLKKHYVAARMSGAGSRGFGSGGGVGTYGGAASAAKWGFLAPEACSVNRTRVHRANVTECVREACERRGKGVFLREGDYDLGRVWDEPCEVDACCVLDMQGDKGARVWGGWLLRDESRGNFTGVGLIHQALGEDALDVDIAERPGPRDEALFHVHGGPWRWYGCALRSAGGDSLSACQWAWCEVLRSEVGGLRDRGGWTASNGILARGNCKVAADDCVIEYTGYMAGACVACEDKAAVNISGSSFRTSGYGVSLKGTSRASLAHCSMREVEFCLVAKDGESATLAVYNSVLAGEYVWDGEDEERPGDLTMTNPDGACKDFLRGLCKREVKGGCKFAHTLKMVGVHSYTGLKGAGGGGEAAGDGGGKAKGKGGKVKKGAAEGREEDSGGSEKDGVEGASLTAVT